MAADITISTVPFGRVMGVERERERDMKGRGTRHPLCISHNHDRLKTERNRLLVALASRSVNTILL